MFKLTTGVKYETSKEHKLVYDDELLREMYWDKNMTNGLTKYIAK